MAKHLSGIAGAHDPLVAICCAQHVATYGAPRSMLRWGAPACESLGIGLSRATYFGTEALPEREQHLALAVALDDSEVVRSTAAARASCQPSRGRAEQFVAMSTGAVAMSTGAGVPGVASSWPGGNMMRSSGSRDVGSRAKASTCLPRW